MLAVTCAALILALVVLPPVFGGDLWLLDWTPGEQGPLVPRSVFGLDGGVTAGAALTAAGAIMCRVLGRLGGSLPFIVFFPLAAVGAARLAGSAWVRCIPAALLFTLNPFVFDRLYAGQIGVLLGYACLPFAVRASLDGPQARGLGRFRAAAWWAGAAALSVHFLWIVGVVALAVVVQQRASVKALAWLGLSVVSVGVLSAYLLFAQLGQARPVAVTAVDLAAYRTQSDPHLGLYGNVLGLYGFWRIGPRLPKQDLSIWPFLLAVLLVVIATGAVAGYRDAARRPLTVVLGISGVLGFFLALGDQGVTGPAYSFLYANLPLFDVMREPEKFSSLLALSYAVFFGWGVQAVVAGLDGRLVRTVVTVVVVLLPVDYVPTIFNGLNGQIRASHVPASYAKANSLLGKGSGQILALPWHQYLSFPFTGRVVANPVPTLFDRQVIAGDDVELPGVATTSTSRRSAYLEFLYAHGADTHAFGSLVAPLGVQYVVLSKTVDFASYAWLAQQRDLRQVLDTPDLTVWRNTEPVDQGHRVGSTLTLRDWGQLVAVADTVDLAQQAVVLSTPGPGPVVMPPVAPAPAQAGAPVSRPSHVSATVPAGPQPLVTMAEPYDPAWRLGGRAPVELGDGAMAFRVPSGRAVIRFTHWPVTALGYLISGGAALLLLVFGSFRLTRRRRVRYGQR